MATLSQSMVSSTSRALGIRVRQDLKAKRQRYQGRAYWVVKDPIALQYFRFEEEEFAILQMLDGESSLDEIAEQFEAEFPPQTIRVEELQQFIGMLHRSGLVIANAGGQGEQLKKRFDERRKKERLGKFTNILSIQFKGFDPELLLNAMYSFPPVRWFFSMPAFVMCLLLSLAAATLVLVQIDVFLSRLPDFQTFFARENWLLLAIVLGCTKVLHEFGHGLSCKHFGGECHEMGVMLLVLTPCLYCNVSDSWMLPSRWKRAAIGAAGMYVEVVLASFCTFIWWFTDPHSMLNQVCLNIMFVSSVSTILFNANPLLRYDGYYILSDILEIPNLRQKANSILTRKLGAWCLGLEEPEDPFLPKSNQWLFALYTVAATMYRWVVLFSILYFLNSVFEPMGLKILGQGIALFALYGMVVMPMWKLYKYFKVPGRLAKVKRVRMLVSATILLAAIAGAATIPIPHAVYCPAEIQLRDAETVYARAGGLLESIDVEPGQRVTAGQQIARLSNPQNELEIVRLEGKVDRYETEIENLDRMSLDQAQASDRHEQLTEMLAAAREMLAQEEKDAQQLTILAPIDGIVIPPPYRKDRRQREDDLKSWEGTPLDEKNLGAAIQDGTVFCQIGDPNRFEARMAIEQGDTQFANTGGLDVEIMLAQAAGFVYRSRIETPSGEAMTQSPERLSSLTGGKLPTEMNESGVPVPMTPHFDALAPLYPPPADASRKAHESFDVLRVGLTGTAKIHTPPRSVWKRIKYYALRTFNFDM